MKPVSNHLCIIRHCIRSILDGEVVISEEGDEEDAYTFNAYYLQDGQNVHIMGENLDLTGTYDGRTLTLSEQSH